MIEKDILAWIEEAEAITEAEEGNVFGDEDRELERLRDLVATIKAACQQFTENTSEGSAENDSSGFEEFTGHGQRQHGEEPEVALYKHGTLKLSPKALEALGSPKTVTLLYNHEKQCIGIRAGGDLPLNLRSCTIKAFAKHYNIDIRVVGSVVQQLQHWIDGLL